MGAFLKSKGRRHVPSLFLLMEMFSQLSKLGQKDCLSQPASFGAKLWESLGTYKKICDDRERLCVKEGHLVSMLAATKKGLAVQAASQRWRKDQHESAVSGTN